MLIAVGSENTPKLEAVRKAARKYFPKGTFVDVRGFSAESGVSNHPISPSEARRGAMNRAMCAYEAFVDADFWVGIEGGLEEITVIVPETFDRLVEKRWIESGYCLVIDRKARFAYGQAGSVRVPDHLIESIMHGKDLSAAMDEHFGISRIGESGGYTDWLTGGALDRTDSYVPGLIAAFSEVVNNEHF
jgi:inosine/xanthosine triphosphatase